MRPKEEFGRTGERGDCEPALCPGSAGFGVRQNSAGDLLSRFIRSLICSFIPQLLSAPLQCADTLLDTGNILVIIFSWERQRTTIYKEKKRRRKMISALVCALYSEAKWCAVESLG